MTARRKRKPAMPPEHRQRALEAKKRRENDWTASGFVFSGGPHDYSYDCPFRDQDRDLWWWLVADALGTRNRSVIHTSLKQLTALCDNQWKAEDQEWLPEPMQLNTALAICAACEPRDEAQAAIAMQMVGLHFAAMKLAAASCRYAWGADERSVATQVRASKAYASLARTLAQLQGRLAPRECNQTIQVIYVDQRDQRQQTAVAGGGGNFGGQAHGAAPHCDTALTQERSLVAETSTTVRRAALPGPCANDREAMPLASGAGKARVPNAWWGQRLWRAFRQA